MIRIGYFKDVLQTIHSIVIFYVIDIVYKTIRRKFVIL